MTSNSSWVQIPPSAPSSNLGTYLESTTNLSLSTIERRSKAIRRLAEHVDLFDSKAVVKYLNNCSLANGTRNIVLQAYHDYQRMYGLEPVPLKKYHTVQKIVFIPLEKEIDSLIAGCTQKLSCFLSLLKETGLRPIEAWSLEFNDIDTVQKTVNVRTAKHGLPRVLNISDRLINLLFALKRNSKYIFAVGTDTLRFPKELSHFTRNYIDRRRMIAKNLKNDRLLKISLYTFRHWKATMLYISTRDIFFCKYWLGHSRIENTMKYVHVSNSIQKDISGFVSKVASTVEEACSLVEQGFEYVSTMNGMQIFKKRK